jgi:hypothetical protein
LHDPVWADWSQQQLERTSLQTTLYINPVIYAELSIAFDKIEGLEAVLKAGEFRLKPILREVLYLCGESVCQLPPEKGNKSGRIARLFHRGHTRPLRDSRC